MKVLYFTIVALLISSINLLGQANTVLSLKTDTLNIQQGTSFSVSIEIDSVLDLHSFELELAYNPQIIRVISISEGSFLHHNNQFVTTWEIPEFDNITGKISNIKCTRIAEIGRDGSGGLVVINFQAHTTGSSNILFNIDNCNLFDSNDNEIIISEILSSNVNIFNDPVAEISIPDTSGAPNRIMDIPILITGIEYSAIISVLMTVVTDTDYLIPLEVLTEGTKTESWQTPIVNIKDGTIIFAMAGYSQLSEDGKLIILRYLVNDNAQEDEISTIKIEYILLNEGDPTTIINNCNFLIKGLQIAGKLKYYGTENPIPDAKFEITGKSNSSVYSDSEGNFSFTELHYGDYNLVVEKQSQDITCITPFDAALILQHSVQLTQLSYHQMIAADVTGDKTVSPLDAANILQYSVGLIDNLPVMDNNNDYWQFTPLNYTLNDTNWFNIIDTIEYKPLESAQFNQNFVGIIYGDVSQNWEHTNSYFTKTNNSVKINSGNIVELNNELIQIPLNINGANGALSLFIKIFYETDKLQLIAIDKTDIISEYQMAYNTKNNILRISLASAEVNDLNGTILTLKFRKLS